MHSAMFGEDINILKKSVKRIIEKFKDQHINFVEIGVLEGGTSNVLMNEIESIHKDYTYYGIDPDAKIPNKLKIDFKFHLIEKISEQAVQYLPSERIHWLLIDGCHCHSCVLCDFIMYNNKLIKGGEILFHDASPSTQNTDPQLYPFMKNIHIEEVAKKGIAVRKVLDDSISGCPYFELIEKTLDQPKGGVEIYRRK